RNYLLAPTPPPPLSSFYCSADHPHLHSFPTRRSSDLREPAREDLRTAALGLRHPVGPERGSATEEREPLLEAARAPRSRCRARRDRKSTRLNSSHDQISYAGFCLKKKKKTQKQTNSNR